MSWVHVDDLVELIIFSLGRPGVRGPVNGASANPVTNAEFTTALASVLRRPALLTVPARALRLLYGEMAEMILGSQRVIPQALLSAGFEFRYPHLLPALQNLLA
jgi:hypothetical protein